MDQYHGQGGTYRLDPVTGERVLLERTEGPELAPPSPSAADPAPAPPQAERRRARVARGRFRGDDPSTPDVNEAWQ